jgi:hypothetical protein
VVQATGIGWVRKRERAAGFFFWNKAGSVKQEQEREREKGSLLDAPRVEGSAGGCCAALL